MPATLGPVCEASVKSGGKRGELCDLHPSLFYLTQRRKDAKKDKTPCVIAPLR